MKKQFMVLEILDGEVNPCISLDDRLICGVIKPTGSKIIHRISIKVKDILDIINE